MQVCAHFLWPGCRIFLLDELLSFIFMHFPVMIFHFCCNICKIFAEGNFLRRKISYDSEATTVTSLPRDIHGAPAESLVVKLAEVIGSFKTLRKMVLFWSRVVAEVSQFHRTWILRSFQNGFYLRINIIHALQFIGIWFFESFLRGIRSVCVKRYVVNAVKFVILN